VAKGYCLLTVAISHTFTLPSSCPMESNLNSAKAPPLPIPMQANHNPISADVSIPQLNVPTAHLPVITDTSAASVNSQVTLSQTVN